MEGLPPSKPINIEIRMEMLGNDRVYNFSYAPGTVHVASGTQLRFNLTGEQLSRAWVVFDVPVKLPVPNSDFYVQVYPETKQSSAATIDAKGAHHYQFIGMHPNGDLVADVYCPSVIVH